MARCEVKQHDELIKPFIDIQKEINIKESQQNDEQIKKMKNRPNKGTTTATEEKKFLEINGIVSIFQMEAQKAQDSSCMHYVS